MPSYSCRICHKTFTRLSSLDRHKETKHPELFDSKVMDDKTNDKDDGSNHEMDFDDLVNPRPYDIFDHVKGEHTAENDDDDDNDDDDEDNESTKDDEDNDEEEDKNSKDDSEHEEDEVKYNFWGHLRQIVYKHNKAKINQMVEQLMEQSPDMSKDEAQNKVAVDILPNFRKQLYRLYFSTVRDYAKMRNNPAHKKFMRTKCKLEDEDDLSDDEALHNAIEQRKFLILKRTQLTDDDVKHLIDLF